MPIISRNRKKSSSNWPVSRKNGINTGFDGFCVTFKHESQLLEKPDAGPVLRMDQRHDIHGRIGFPGAPDDSGEYFGSQTVPLVLRCDGDTQGNAPVLRIIEDGQFADGFTGRVGNGIVQLLLFG